MNKTTLLFIAIYVATLIYMLTYNLTHSVLNDGVLEYRTYLLNIKEGWLYRYSSINSCLVSIWFPSMIQKIFGADLMTVYRVFPPFFYALTPAFTYLIAKRYLGYKESVLAALVLVTSSYIFFFPDLGRVGVALGVFAGMIWALLDKRLLLSILFAFLVVFAHYGMAIVAVGLVMSILTGRLFWDRRMIKVTIVAFGVLVFFIGVWHFGIAHYSGDSMLATMLRPDEARGILQDFIPGVRVDVPQGDFFELESRDYVTQEAFGVHFATNPVPLKIEIILNWIVVGFISLGMLLVVRNKDVDKIFKLVLLTMYGLTAASAIIPQVSVFYGTQRVWFTSMIVLAACFPVGVNWAARRTHVPTILLAAIVLTLYGATTAGWIYPLFGLTKTLPVVLTLP